MRKERLGRTRVALSAGLLIGGLWTGAAALFTDSATTDAAFTSGSVDIAVTDENATFFSASEMAPGDVVFEPLTVDNDGSLDFTYTMATVDDGSALAAGLAVGIKTGVATCDAAGWAGGASVNTGADWTDSAIASRALAAGGSEALCFRVELPSGADNSLQGLSTTVAVNFDAQNS